MVGDRRAIGANGRSGALEETQLRLEYPSSHEFGPIQEGSVTSLCELIVAKISLAADRVGSPHCDYFALNI